MCARSEAEMAAKAAERHQRERDDAIREAARIEGKMQALQAQLDEARGGPTRLQHMKSAAKQADGPG